jgi:hypothetical protein
MIVVEPQVNRTKEIKRKKVFLRLSRFWWSYRQVGWEKKAAQRGKFGKPLNCQYLKYWQRYDDR